MAIVLEVKLSSEQMAALRAAMSLTPAEIDAVALAVVAQLKRETLSKVTSMTVAEFAAQARITPNYVRQLVKRGVIEAVRPNGKGDMRITAEEAAKYLAGSSKHGDAG